MNTPPMPADRLTPKLSPSLLHLDDNIPSLTTPSLMHLEDNKAYPTMYRTSLSKLTEKARKGRSLSSNRSSETPTSILRSASPIRTMINNPPKMLKPEYITHPTLLQKAAAPAMMNNIKLTIKESLANMSQSMQDPKQQVCVPYRKSHSRGLSNASSAFSGATVCENSCSSIPENVPAKSQCRVASSSSTTSTSTTLDLKELPQEIDYSQDHHLSDLGDFVDKNGFVVSSQSKRSSFMSTISSNYDDPNHWLTNTSYNLNPQNARRIVSDELHDELHDEDRGSNECKPLQTEHLELRIKQLELQIAELKLQNDELRHSVAAHRTLQDKFMFEALHEAQRGKDRHKREVERKMKQLEKKIENYKRVIKTLMGPTTNTTNTTAKARVPMVDSSALQNISEDNQKEKMQDEICNTNDSKNSTQGEVCSTTIEKSDESIHEPARGRRITGYNLKLRFEVE